MKRLEIKKAFWPLIEGTDYMIIKSFRESYKLSINFLFEDGIAIEYNGDFWLDPKLNDSKDFILLQSNKLKLIVSIFLLQDSIEISINNGIPWIINGIFDEEGTEEENI